MLTVELLAVPVWKVVVVVAANDGTLFHVVVLLQVAATGVMASTRAVLGAVVTRRDRVAVSAPPVVGIEQVERSNRTSIHLRLPLSGWTSAVVVVPKLVVGLFSSTYASVVAVEPVSVQVDFVNACEPAQRWCEPTERVAANAVPVPTATVATS